ncbi:DUF6481 family protein [Phyllobacterium zundukense]|uniref:Uncharacterized protein n=1 Tax=Phyllobacterium zundukense TaxID=1867719 RepID=A0A2N9W347_9HYPH|nr:DUF6481 family protein [Phyllobacterium zundukense]ATU94323.1 hypothetical protein BLM14_21480 [Phyllobacterium zundukense]PIO46165.1 hypothetical protein B5P45_03985 [Phyllobacterium zundukense]
MKHVQDFADRRNAAAEAKKALLKKFVTAPKANDPQMVAKRTEREALSAARAARRAERERLFQEEQNRQQVEAAAVIEAAAAEANAREADAKNRISRVVSDEAERKAERDRRYAARKARQG